MRPRGDRRVTGTTIVSGGGKNRRAIETCDGLVPVAVRSQLILRNGVLGWRCGFLGRSVAASILVARGVASSIAAQGRTGLRHHGFRAVGGGVVVDSHPRRVPKANAPGIDAVIIRWVFRRI